MAGWVLRPVITNMLTAIADIKQFDPGRCAWNFVYVILKHILVYDISGLYGQIAIK